MKKIFSLMMLCLCGLAFVSCEKEDDGPTVKNKFKSCVFVAETQFSEDVLGFFDITMTFTAMDGSVKEVKPDNNGKISMVDKYDKLPATVKYEVKAVKKATYEEYKASKEKFDFVIMSPGAHANWLTTEGKEAIAYTDASIRISEGVLASDVDSYFEIHDKEINFTVEGTYTKTDEGCRFDAK